MNPFIDIPSELKQLSEFLKSHNAYGFFNSWLIDDTEDGNQNKPFVEIFSRKFRCDSMKDIDYRRLHVYAHLESHKFLVKGTYLRDQMRVTLFELLLPADEFYELIDHFINWVNAPGYIPIEELVKWYEGEYKQPEQESQNESKESSF